MAAFTKAVDAGADGIELDVRFDGDKNVVVFHDNKLERLANRAGTMDALSASSRAQLRVKGEPVPTLREVLHETTALVVAHRPSTVMLADRVALLEAGRITAVGTHSELLRESEHYRHVISSLEVEEARLREREVNL